MIVDVFATPMITFEGVNAAGVPSSGASSGSPAEVAQDLFDAGWQSATLTVTIAGDAETVGGVGFNTGEARRMWWSAQDRFPDPNRLQGVCHECGRMTPAADEELCRPCDVHGRYW